MSQKVVAQSGDYLFQKGALARQGPQGVLARACPGKWYRESLDEIANCFRDQGRLNSLCLFSCVIAKGFRDQGWLNSLCLFSCGVPVVFLFGSKNRDLCLF